MGACSGKNSSMSGSTSDAAASALASSKVSQNAAVQSQCAPKQITPKLRQCSMGYVTGAAIAHFLEMHPEVPKEEAGNLRADPDTSKPLYFWQLYSVLGTDRIIKVVENLYTSIANDEEEPWLPHAFTRLCDWEHHIQTQAGFWLDAMGRGKCYHGGEYRLHFHHHHNAGHVMTQVGAARWMHHMRHALDISDLGSDPRVRGTIEEFLRTRMEKYAEQFSFETGDRVYKTWNSSEWIRTDTWHLLGPQPQEPQSCPLTGLVGTCAIKERQTSEQSTASGSSSPR